MHHNLTSQKLAVCPIRKYTGSTQVPGVLVNVNRLQFVKYSTSEQVELYGESEWVTCLSSPCGKCAVYVALRRQGPSAGHRGSCRDEC